ncbi:hypothetical protein PR048_016770 [Dryococelus australis]|uniref:Uncharacterized protein n=1 Tax=Dryococelus australis TaxID=614101 RepID=A0ABQ9H7Q7_9NEOP|nr:hypothetical protein PR048_016770 [Dryococelus australis]
MSYPVPPKPQPRSSPKEDMSHLRHPFFSVTVSPGPRLLTTLGVHIDSTLTWHQHIQTSTSKSKTVLRILRPLLTTLCANPEHTLIHLWRAFILPLLLYASTNRAYVHPSTYRPLSPGCNEDLRIILGRPRDTPVKLLYRLGTVVPPAHLIRRHVEKFYCKVRNYPNQVISSIASYNPGILHPHRRLLDFLAILLPPEPPSSNN